VVGVHWGANTGWIRLTLVTPRPPLGLLRDKLVIDTATIDTYRQVVKHGVLSLPATVFTHVIGVIPNRNMLRFENLATQLKIRPNAVELTHFELKLPGAAPPWPGKNLFFL
jgi:hypothetical protein